MEENYKVINHELVLKNQDLKKTIAMLRNEMIAIKEEQIIMKQQNSRFLDEIKKNSDIKNEVMKHVSDIFKITGLIVKLICPGIHESDGQNVSINLANVNNLRQSSNYNNKSDSTNSSPHVSYVNERRRRSSNTQKSSSFNEIVSSPPRKSNRFNKSSEKIDIQQQESDLNVENNQTLPQAPIPQRLSMTTILEADERSNNFQSVINTKSSVNSETLKNSIRNNKSINENFDTVETFSTMQKSPTTMIASIPVINIDNVVVDNLTISNVPCSTPYQPKRCASDLNTEEGCDLSGLSKKPKVVLKRLTLKDLQSQSQEMRTDSNTEVNTRIVRACTKDNSNEDNSIQNEGKTFKKKKTSKSRNTKSKTFQEDDINKENSSDEKDDLSSISTKRTLRTRKSNLCFTESNLRHKLRR